MKIKSIKAFPVRPADSKIPSSKARQTSWVESTEIANPMSRYPGIKGKRNRWNPGWASVGCIATAEDGTWGFGMTRFSKPICPIINDHFAPLLIGEECMGTEKLWDVMFRTTSFYSSAGLASYAISAVDLALWDLKGKLLNRPVYELLGGPARDKIFCYATGNDTAWHMELGFKATKLSYPHNPADGLAALERSEELVSETRRLIGPGIELMLDCWMSMDVEFAVRLAERLKPYELKWLEDCLIPEDFRGFIEMRKRLPWQSLATGEHWYTPLPFSQASSDRVVDIFQPDIEWVGGLTAMVKICHIAEGAGISVIPHAGMNNAYGQHVGYAMPGIPWGEYYIGSAPGVPLHEVSQPIPGIPVPNNGYLIPNDAPGFGLELTLADVESIAAELI